MGLPETGGYSVYFTVGSPNLQGSPLFLLPNSAPETFSMLWGSIDTYNAVECCVESTCDKV
jgi:hypothetical protein